MAPGSSEQGQIGPGLFMGVVGPSGAGKDTLIAAARATFARSSHVIFTQRLITRQADPTEDCLAVTADDFDRMRANGALAVSWEAHGLSYAIPASVDDEIRAGRTIVANLSRAVVPQVRKRYARSLILLIDVAAHIRARRLAQRGRENEGEILSRLSRAVTAFGPLDADLVIDNSGPLAAATERFARVIDQTLQQRHRDAIED